MYNVYWRVQYQSELSGCWIDRSIVFTSWREGIEFINTFKDTKHNERLYPIFEHELTERDRVYNKASDYMEVYDYAADPSDIAQAIKQA